jgi:MSHA biogenesis protein MshP
MRPETQRGFSLVAAIFLLVVLALLGALIASVTGMQQASGQLDLLGVRAYQSARAGLEWGASQVLDPNADLPQANCSVLDDLSMPSCPASPTPLPALVESLQGFTVTMKCEQRDFTEGNRKLRVFQIIATACNEPSGGSCPNPNPPQPGIYVERELQASLAKCKQVSDTAGAAPRCRCG